MVATHVRPEQRSDRLEKTEKLPTIKLSTFTIIRLIVHFDASWYPTHATTDALNTNT